MWPWGHLAVAYLLYGLYTHGRYGRGPRAAPAVALALGSQFPDLIDKPLAWGLGVLPGGRTLAHSLLFAAALLSLVSVLGLALGRVVTAGAFAVGHLSHVATDLPPTVLLGYPRGGEFLFWPLLAQPTFGSRRTLLAQPTVFEPIAEPLTDPGTYFAFQFGLFVLATAVWFHDGLPGIGAIPGVDR